MKFGYARTSSVDQNLEAQISALEVFGCDAIRTEQASATTRNNRPELQSLLDFARDGDVIVCTRIDRLARSAGDLADIMATFEAKGVGLQCTEQPVDTTSATGRAFIGMLGIFAQMETEIRKERCAEGIAKAKARGVYKGRPKVLDADRVAELKAEGLGPSEIAKRLRISRSSVYRLQRQRNPSV